MSIAKFYLVYTDNLSTRGQRTLGLGTAIGPALLNSKLLLDVILVNQETVDPNFTSIKGSFFETVSGFPSGHGHCFTASQQLSCCRVFDPNGYRCQSAGHPYTLTELDQDIRLRPDDETTIFSYVHASEKSQASNAMQIVKTDAVLASEPFSHDRTMFYLCEEHHDLLSRYFHQSNLYYNSARITALPSLSEIAFNQITTSTYSLALEYLTKFSLLLKDVVSAFYDPKTIVSLILSKLPSDQILRMVPVSHDYIIAPLNRIYKKLPFELTTNPKLVRFMNVINGIRIVDVYYVKEMVLQDDGSRKEVTRLFEYRPIQEDIYRRLVYPASLFLEEMEQGIYTPAMFSYPEEKEEVSPVSPVSSSPVSPMSSSPVSPMSSSPVSPVSSSPVNPVRFSRESPGWTPLYDSRSSRPSTPVPLLIDSSVPPSSSPTSFARSSTTNSPTSSNEFEDSDEEEEDETSKTFNTLWVQKNS